MNRNRKLGFLPLRHESGALFALALGIIGATIANPADAKTVAFDAGDFGYTWPMAINASKAITGYYEEFNGTNYVDHAFLRTADGTITTIDVDGATCGTLPFSINRSGAIAGRESDANCFGHGFVRSPDGTVAVFDVPHEIYTVATSINNAGVATGIYVHNNQGVPHAFMRSARGKITHIDPPGSANTLSLLINNAGVIAGSFRDKNNTSHGFLRAADGTFTTFEAPDAGKSAMYVMGMNDAGEVVGTYAGQNAAFLRQSDGTVIQIGGADYAATAINNEGTVVGQYQDEFGVHGFIRQKNGTIKPFDFDPSLDTYPTGINDKGDIAGAYDDETRLHGPGAKGDEIYTHGFLRGK